MSNYGYTNDQGEPIMDGAAYRFEQQLDMDSMADYYADRFYDDDGYPDEIDPDDCDHGDGTYLGSADGDATEGDYECDICGAIAGRWVMGEDGWPERV